MVQIHRIVARGAAPIGRRNAVRVGTSDGPARSEDRLALGIFWSAAVAPDAGAAADFRRLPCHRSGTPERSASHQSPSAARESTNLTTSNGDYRNGVPLSLR